MHSNVPFPFTLIETSLLRMFLSWRHSPPVLSLPMFSSAARCRSVRVTTWASWPPPAPGSARTCSRAALAWCTGHWVAVRCATCGARCRSTSLCRASSASWLWRYSCVCRCWSSCCCCCLWLQSTVCSSLWRTCRSLLAMTTESGEESLPFFSVFFCF